ncbi:MAG: hypothetical protein HY721_12445 [Planctomycetes bacterium]|nr:hypothetical protein [Planctomycetota bacterium]
MAELLSLAAVIAALSGQPAASVVTVQVQMRSSAERERLARDRFVVHDLQAGALRLARSYLLSHALGKGFRDTDPLEGEGAARVGFDLCSSAVRGAILYVFGEAGGGALEVNGQAVEGPNRRGHVGWAGREVPASALRQGENLLTFRGGSLTIDRWAAGGRSARSFDGGRTFRTGALGPAGDVPGEYLVRLRVLGHPPEGHVLSPVIDLREAAAEGPVVPIVRPVSLLLQARELKPEGTEVAYDVRWGTRRAVSAPAWTDWAPVEPGRETRVPEDRPRSPLSFVQWRAALRTSRADRTPEVAEVKLEVRAELERPATQGIRGIAYSRPQLDPTFYPFAHESDSPRVRHLREKHRLRDAVARGATELDRQSELRVWVGDAWVESWETGKLHYIPPWDALEILELAPRGLCMGMCTHKGATFAQAACAVGYNARVLIVTGHCLAEVWSNELGKWILQDPGPGLNPERTRTLTCRYDVGGAPANALDVLRAGAGQVAAVPHPRDAGQRDTAGVWCGTYDRFGIPLRNDHLSRPEPAEQEHGFSHYRYDGYLWWSDDLDEPRYGEYSFLSNRAADFYPVLNTVRIDLGEEAPGVLRVELSSETPNLARYRVRVDGGDETAAAADTFSWRLHAGENRLEAAAENAFGVRGPVQRVVLAYQGP